MEPYGSFGYDGGKAGGFFLKAFLIFGFQVWFRRVAPLLWFAGLWPVSILQGECREAAEGRQSPLFGYDSSTAAVRRASYYLICVKDFKKYVKRRARVTSGDKLCKSLNMICEKIAIVPDNTLGRP